MLRDQARFDLVAHFPSVQKARTAEGTFGGRVEEGTTVTFGLTSWVGLGAGVILGLAVGLLLYRDLLSIGFLPAALAQRGAVVTTLWAVILGATGWIIGTSIHLFTSTPGTDRYELHVTVPAEKLADARRSLIAGGATMVSIKEHGVTDSVVQASEHDQAATPVPERGN